nr:AbrB family transcriptional regulator [Pseudomonas sp. NFR16]
MARSVRTIAKCQDPGDGSGDVIIDLPPDALAAMNVDLSDCLSIGWVDGAIVLRPTRDANTQS